MNLSEKLRCKCPGDEFGSGFENGTTKNLFNGVKTSACRMKITE
jgi:hypothetical protein